MRSQKKAQQRRDELTATDRLGLRVAAMISSPKAQLERAVTVHQLDTDPDEAWESVMGLISEEDGVELIFNDDGSVTLRWSIRNDGEHQDSCSEMEPVEEKPPF
ncbi:TPA: DUF1654 domain-containing protein [Pseudomonas aeruginosa]|uniref:Uncharacterized protein n=1 Tax=Pseudomonas aeruginosa TaxID=287 RepID=A0A241XEJ9_PSEAI|nr:DUF1654 domain-containing protein [Pseudomonas aeruginosa]AMA38083.1 hypothetical protein DPADHS01_19125 [Pseudomonas aeruginosa DHS01]AWR42851.1 DUF1654 domain-containing protein [Pseudomonas aeruginosa]EIU5018539.1 DUF1654 domain-containing protein [Pseudomonas aeruginosa]EIZ7654098.1 DUF1654 domain-containing protein [Pseudomonas aeruginosa]EKM7584799.1 DUF1654 domain-containing protein [Pseudomonas aeruginosa]